MFKVSNSSLRIFLGAFLGAACGLMLPTANATPAYSVNAVNFYGNSYGTPQTAGDIFTPTVNLIVSSLGFFDYQQDGLGESHEVGIFDNTGTLLTSAVVAAGTASPLVGEFRYTNIMPLTLYAGETYTMAALVTTQADVLGYANVSGIQVNANISLGAHPGRYIFTSGPNLEFPTQITGCCGEFYVIPNFELAIAPAAVPEPNVLTLFGLGAIVLIAYRWRRNGVVIPILHCGMRNA